jgi:hypothetical protein
MYVLDSTRYKFKSTRHTMQYEDTFHIKRFPLLKMNRANPKWEFQLHYGLFVSDHT